MFFLVYRITNTVNGKHYTGAHETIDKDDGYFGSGKTLKFAIAKYGKSVFKKTILCECDNQAEMFVKEKELVSIGPMSYNMKAGGHGGAYGPVSSETRAKISMASKRIQAGQEYRQRMSRSCTESPKVREHMLALNAPRMAMKFSPEEKRKQNTLAQQRCRTRKRV